jgi:SAM-dependent methyltransferase
MPAGSGDDWPAHYERGRPGWPRAAGEVAELPTTATVLDLGAGTGKLTRLLVSLFDRVLAVEPADAMRSLLEQICEDAEVHAGHAQAIPVRDASVDAVFAAEAFHWFDDERSLDEIARVLRPRGAFVMMWNLPAGPWEPSTESAESVLGARVPEGGVDHDPLDLDGPRRGDGEWRGSFTAAGFETPTVTRVPNPQTLDRDGLVSFFASMGWIAELADESRLPLLERVRSLLTASEYRRSWTTQVYRTRRVRA